MAAVSAVGVQVPATAQDRGGSVAVAQYDLGDTAFTDPQSGTVSELRAVVHYPRHLTDRLPLIVLAHGSWWACDAQDAATWPCPYGSRPFPSYRGYDYLGAALAARGFVVVSISVDGINQTSFDYGDRARLINEHLRLWRQLAVGGDGPLTGRLVDPSGRSVAPDFTGHVDMARVGTLGHSRGGKGVMWQASDKHRDEWPSGVRIRAVLGLAPVKFDDPQGDHSDTLITTLPFTVVTSGCDGAVHEEGQEYLDDAAGLNTTTVYSVSLRDANHNFYNTAWTPPSLFGEDDSTCPDRELAPARQQNALTAYAIAFYRYELYGDRDGLPILTGKRPLPGVTATTRVVPAHG
ncbi:hypothetical protein M2163_001352 [Streptomyces sp. SAI-135]|uniref:alpha/beta hydrolase n=1 Tax=unclassified Streptomyces TaxID=2593676 RepID=UPI002473B0CD|nr:MULTISPECIES: alpha/beta hydrolase [unclassified Streptomyces]MDH6521657.1 hypothetical protein [Streptomyces sp. SAI-090]MDH6553947.1 hypothetical protein [Streptomyces sp. SAI-041]MDH6573025.1 hypothetical protein [Streptomyces sp. SAI-117]MDH6582013.1 hypothetical protein [Streptomyces sp. SAI-133]MDH6614244.1 hypothetical protein [Streptomyces sp. SAI-135]